MLRKNLATATLPVLLVAFFLLANSSGADLMVKLTNSSDSTLSGSLQTINSESVVLLDSEQPQTVSLSDLHSLIVQNPTSRVGPSARVRLHTGTEIAAQDIILKDDILVVRPRRQSELHIPIRQIRSVRFRASSPGTDSKWLGLFDTEGRGDLLAVRRDGNQIDSIRGGVIEITPTVVRVDINGDAIEAPIERLEGIIFSSANNPSAEDESRQAPAVVEDLYGSRWRVASLRLQPKGSSLSITTVLGSEHSIPLDQLKEIQWASGSVLLASLTPADQTYRDSTSLVNESNAELQTLLSHWLGPAASKEADLIMGAGSALEFRVDPGMARLVGSVRREKGVTQGSRVMAKITIGEVTAWEEELVDANPLGFEIDVAGAGRVRLEVMPLDDGDGGDLLRFLRPRFLK